MDWDRVIEICVAILAYGIAFQVVLWVFGYELVPKNKYRFKCPICDFKVSSSNNEIVTRVRVSHQHSLIDDNR